MTDEAEAPPGPPSLDPATERALAVGLFNHVWGLLGEPDRTSAQDDAMVHAAHASRWHWGQVGSPQHWAIGEWQCSRVYAVLGHGAEALRHARRCLALVDEYPMDDFVRASAHEALARAYAVMGEHEAAIAERNSAYVVAIDLEDDDDRGVIEADLATLPIRGLA